MADILTPEDIGKAQVTSAFFLFQALPGYVLERSRCFAVKLAPVIAAQLIFPRLC